MIPVRYANQSQSTRIRERGGVPYLTFRLLDAAGVTHGFSTRLGGVSTGDCASMNLSFHRGDDPEAVRENHRRLARAVGYDAARLVCSDQVHGTRIHKVTEADCGKGVCRESDLVGIDGLATDVPGIPLMTFYADCVPLFFYDPVRRAAALAHAGWRGTAAQIGRHMVAYMTREYGCVPERMLCAIGPSICRSCYEVSEDVAEQFAFFPEAERADILHAAGAGKYHLDLWEANRRILLAAGIREEHVAVTDICTCCNPELLFSHRASHGRRGNLAAVILIEPDAEGSRGNVG